MHQLFKGGGGGTLHSANLSSSGSLPASKNLGSYGQNMSGGILTQRHARAEWAKPTVGLSQGNNVRPLNSHKSNDSKQNLKQKVLQGNVEHLNNSGNSEENVMNLGLVGDSVSPQQNQFMFNTYSQSNHTQKHQSVENHLPLQHTVNKRNHSLKGWGNIIQASASKESQKVSNQGQHQIQSIFSQPSSYSAALLQGNLNADQNKSPGPNVSSHTFDNMNNINGSNDKTDAILKNLQLQNHSDNNSQLRSLQSSGSSSSLMLDSAIKNTLNAQNSNFKSGKKDQHSGNNTTNLSNSSGKIGAPKVLVDIQNQFNSQTSRGKQKVELISVLSQFAPPQTAKSITKTTKVNLRHSIDKPKQKSSSGGNSYTNGIMRIKDLQTQKSDVISQFEEESKQQSKNDFQRSNQEHKPEFQNPQETQSVSSDLDAEDEINESVVMFKQSTQQAKSQDPTPQSMSLQSYKEILQGSSDKLDLKILAKRKESRNQMHPMFLSHQVQNDLNLLNQNPISSKTSQPSSSSSTGNEQQLVISEQKQSLSSNKGRKKIQKVQQLNDNGPKAPSEVFQYKLKSPLQANLRIEQLLKNRLNAPSYQVKGPGNQKSVKKTNNKSGKNSTKLNQAFPKPPTSNIQTSIAQPKSVINRIVLNKSGSQDILQTQKQSNSDQFTDIDNIKDNFMYQTQQLSQPFTQTIESSQTESVNKNPAPPVSQEETQLRKQQQYLQGKMIEEIDQNFKDDKQNIRVIARFRPLNNIELEVKETQQRKQEIIEFFSDSKSIQIRDDYYSHSGNLTFTFDHVFKPSTTQEQVFNVVGKETIDDIMSGYNGTIFAYGQTGSGKTFTMYGQDIFDEQLMGIVPRSARQIFNHIRNQDLEIEYQIRVQMVEIYKETLRDLLHDSPEAPTELKIKEDPKRGTYVEGLTDVCIVSEEEIMTVLCTGETIRHVASTTLNQVSSRSHSICFIEIIQKFPNDSEKRGVLNLVDLAGSERVSKSHAQGQALEEAKKINFSLSMLGKVINCLTKNSSYIPYRDSKLTRLLKESLGGNNKTSLIVACSLHYTNIEETVSTLRFAQSAKFIQNKVKMNIKTSPEHLQIIIQQLKQELMTAKEEICRLRLTSTNQNSQQNNQDHSLEYSPQDDFLFKQSSEMDKQSDSDQFQIEVKECRKSMQSQQQLTHTLHNRPHQSLLAKNYDVIETNNQRIQMLSLFSSEFSSIPGTGTPNFISPVKNYEIKLMQMINRNEDLEMKLKSKEKDIEALKSQKEELHQKVSTLKDKIINYKQKNLILEKKIAEYENDKDFMVVSEAMKTNRLEDYESQIQVLTQQVKCLEKALEDSELNCHDLLKDKQSTYQKQIKDYLNDTLKIMRIPVSQALDGLIDKTKEISNLNSFIKQFDLEKDYEAQEKMLGSSEFYISLKEQDLLFQNLYSMELVNAIEEGSVPPEITIYLMKHQLIEASLANHNLQRVLAINRWRQVIEFGKFKIKSELCKIQENTINTLEEVLEKTRKTHDKVRARVDKLENHLYDNRNYYGDIVLLTDPNNGCPQVQSFTKETFKDIQKFNSLKDKVIGINNHNQSVVSLGVSTSNNQNNQKTRFIKTITNKTLRKVFNFVERSPMSRASIGANQSILSQYYVQKHNPLGINKQGTPLRTGGLNSPVLCNFQSPIRRHNTIPYKMSQPQIINFNNQNLGNHEGVMALNKVDNNTDKMTFEDAIVKFFNSDENQEKNDPRIIDFQVLEQNPNSCNKYFFTLDDIQTIEQLDNINEVKDFIKSKFEKQLNIQQLQITRSNLNALNQGNSCDQNLNSLSMQALHNNSEASYSSAQIHQHHNQHNPLFVQYQNNAAYQSQTQSNLQLSSSEGGGNPQQLNSHTTNNNLYAQPSNDFYDNGLLRSGVGLSSSVKQIPCSTSSMVNQFDNHQRQEHIMTLGGASEYMITSTSVIGPNGLFGNNCGGGPLVGECKAGVLYNMNSNNGNNQYYQNEYMDRLQEKIVQLQEEVETQKCRAEEHKRAYYESKRQIEVIRALMEDKESKFKTIMRIEVQQWENALTRMKEMNELELQKKQSEIEKLHQLLAQWIDSYQELELNRGIKPLELEKLLIETFRHKRNRSGLLSEVMKTPYAHHHHKLSQGQMSIYDTRSVYKLGSGISMHSTAQINPPNQQQLNFFTNIVIQDQHSIDSRQGSGNIGLKDNSKSHGNQTIGSTKWSQSNQQNLSQSHQMLTGTSGSGGLGIVTQQSCTLNSAMITASKEKNFENSKKDIKGDNSPVPQEESCLDMEDSQLSNHSIIMHQNIITNTFDSESRFDVFNLQTYEST